MSHDSIKVAAAVVLVFSIGVSVAATYYRYVIEQDFSYETKPLEDFTEDDL